MRGAPSIHTKEARVPTLLLLLRLCGSARFANKSRAYEREYDSEQRAKRGRRNKLTSFVDLCMELGCSATLSFRFINQSLDVMNYTVTA